jgi:hypothetical protein
MGQGVLTRHQQANYFDRLHEPESTACRSTPAFPEVVS